MQRMKLEIITHACIIASCDKIRLVCDPWLSGKVFNNGWSLKNEIKESSIAPESISHVYISHEHPDHLHIPTLKSLNDKWNPTFLIQKTRDQRILSFIRNVLGKKVLEVKDGYEFQLSTDMSIRIYSHGHMDSFALLKIGNCSILNINDCVLKSARSLRSIQKRLPKNTNIDILMSQYSFASYQGNSEERQSLLNSASQHLRWIKEREEYFQPEMLIPFASGVDWCSHENQYLNNYSVTYEQAVASLEKTTIAPVYGRDITIKGVNISMTDKCNFLPPQKRSFCDNDSQNVVVPKNTTEMVDTTFIFNQARMAAKKLNQQNSYAILSLMRLAGLFGFLKPVIIELLITPSQSECIILNPGLRLKSTKSKSSSTLKQESRIMMSADSFEFCLTEQFGAETLWVNSRFEIISGKPKDFFMHFFPSILSNQGFNFPLGYIKFLWSRIVRPKISEI